MKEILQKIEEDIRIIKSSTLIVQQFKQLKEYLISQNLSPIHYFNQIKRNEQYSGLVSETMFFDDNFIYDIVIGAENMDNNFVKIEHVSKFQIATIPNYSSTKNQKGEEVRKVDYISRLAIAYQENTQLYYDIPTEKFPEILQLVEILSKKIK